MAYDPQVIAANLRAERAKADLTQKEVAGKIGVNVNTIGNYEDGKGGLSYENAWKLADLYDMSLDEIGSRSTPYERDRVA